MNKQLQKNNTRKQRPKVSVVALGKSYQHQATQLLNQSFCIDNPIWNYYVKNSSQTFQYVNDIVKKSIDCNLLYGVINEQNQKIIAAVTYFDMNDYLQFLQQIKGKYSQIRLFSELSSYGAELQKEMRNQKYQRGTIIYGLLGATASQYNNSNYSGLLTSVAFIDFASRGYKFYMARCSSDITRKAMIKIGSELIKQIQIPKTNLKFSLVKFQLQKLYQYPQNFILDFWQSVNFKSNL